MRARVRIPWWGSAALRVVAGCALGWWIGSALAAPQLPLVASLAAVLVLVLTFWRPAGGLLLVAGLAPAGALFAAAPVRTPELFAWAFLAGWLLAVWRPLSAAGWPRAVAWPAGLYGVALAASWLSLTVAGAAGIAPLSLPSFLSHSVPQDYLVLSTPEAETWSALQAATGVAFFLAAVAIARDDRGVVRGLARALVASAALLALATSADIARQWADTGYASSFLQRYVSGERESLHFTDLNAAGSVYVLAGLPALMLATFDVRRRWLWTSLLAIVLPALWLAGSLSALMSAVIVGVAIAAALGAARLRPSRMQIGAAVVVAALALTASALLATQRGEGRAPMGQALQLRSQFVETSARMFASSPVFGVGIGLYFDRSSAFMPDELREMYGNENAHNYFAQVFAELGAVGGALFVWLVVATLRRAWSHVRAGDVGDGAVLGLFAGAAAYLVTCLTGHPLLVPGAALPFWAAFGAVTAAPGPDEHDGTARRSSRIAALVLVVLAVEVGISAVSALRAETPPREQGFHAFEVDADGTRFRWMTRHAVTYIPREPGIVTLPLRPPEDERLVEPLVVEIAIAGRVVRRETLEPGRWTTVQVGVRDLASAGFRRVDLRANQQWAQSVRLGIRPAERPISVMVGEIAWTDASAVR